MYEVNIRAEPEKFLDWDKGGQKMYTDAMWAHGGGATPFSGAERGGRAASEYFARQGIPGIKYLDQGSRGGGGQGTSNYVLFRDDIIDIVRKYGWAGLAAFGISEEQAKEAGVDKPKTRIGNKSYEM
jgi:hypothetical protein